MSTGARVQFIRVAPSDRARMTSWTQHVARLTGAPIAALPEHPVILWQLLAANHRVLARGATARVSMDEAKADVATVVDARERLTPRMVSLEASRGYGWVLLDGRQPLLTCARWYALERNRRESLDNTRLGLKMLAAVPLAIAAEESV